MKQLQSLLFASLMALDFAPAPTHADDVAPPPKAKPEDYAAGIELIIEPGLAVQTFLLPLAVYRGTRPDLSDLSVFDGAGQPVAFARRSVAKIAARERHAQVLPFFPLYGQASARASALALQVERSADGTVIAVHTPDARANAENQKLLAYIVHTGAPSEDLTALRVELEAGEGSFVLPLQVEGSDNLSDWHSLAQGEAIGRLAHAGQAVERSRVTIAPTRAEFLRISWSGELPVAVSKIIAEHESVRSESPLAPRQIVIGPVPLKDGAYRLDLGGTLALESVAPVITAENVLLKAALFVGDGSEARKVFDGQIYRLSHASSVLSSAPIALASTRARVLTLRVDSQATEPPKQPLAFDVSYAPDQLLFVARGAAPHLLTFGSHRGQDAPFSADQLIAFLPTAQRESLPLESARAGRARTLAGEAARKAPEAPLPVRTMLLWSVLVAGAATLIWLALRLLTKTRSP